VATTYNVWVILEKTVDDSPQEQIETYEFHRAPTKKDGMKAFQYTQDVLDAAIPHLTIPEAK
jgi:hypothetical protein